MPAARDQLDEEREILHAGTTFRVEIALEALQPPDRLAGQAAHLGEVPRDGYDLGPQAVLDRAAEAFGDGRLELGGSAGKLLERGASTFESRG